jgi:DNA-directed RNA polymerase subunit RPC12/RpoP
MSTKINLDCKRCGYRYAFYSSNIPNARGQNYNCPNCSAEIDSVMKEQIIVAVSSFENVNNMFRQYRDEQDKPLFVMNLENVEIPDQAK